MDPVLDKQTKLIAFDDESDQTIRDIQQKMVDKIVAINETARWDDEIKRLTDEFDAKIAVMTSNRDYCAAKSVETEIKIRKSYESFWKRVNSTIKDQYKQWERSFKGE